MYTFFFYETYAKEIVTTDSRINFRIKISVK